MILNRKNVYFFLFLWLITFLLYLPAAEAGKVGDYYLECVRRYHAATLTDYFFAPWGDSLYYSTLAVLLLMYKMFGLSYWAWHLSAVTMHVINATFLYVLFNRILEDFRIECVHIVAGGGAILFCISPYNTEVIVNDHCFHYTIGYFLQLSVLLLTLKFVSSQKMKYVWFSLILYVFSCYCIELFYLTPVFTFTIVWYYRRVLGIEKRTFRKVFLYFVIPELMAFLVYLVLLVKFTGHVVAHRINDRIDQVHFYYLSASPKNLFHAVFFGRFFPESIRNTVYGFFDSNAGMAVFALSLVLVCAYILIRFKRFDVCQKVTVVFFIWILLLLGLISALNFPGPGYVTYDRYLYYLLPIVYVILLMWVMKMKGFYGHVTVIAAYAVINLCLLIKMNIYWRQSSVIVNNLMNNYPLKPNNGRIALLLNVPESFNGLLMFGARPMAFYDPASSFRLAYNYEHKTQNTNAVCDIAAFDMSSATDGAHVRVIDDSTMNVTLNQPGKWWQYYKTATGTDNYDYRLNMTDTIHWYQLTLRKPASKYLILYTVGDQWKAVDWNKKNVDQY